MEKIADGVWIVRSGFPRKVMNVYLIEDGDGITLFDAGVRPMQRAIKAAAEKIGRPIKRIVLGHAHPDHRGTAALLAGATGAEVWCHTDEKTDAEGDGGVHYWTFSALKAYERVAMKLLLRLWDAGPVKIAETLKAGDRVAGFTVHHLPGHAPGQIALIRERDDLCLATDVLYTINPGSGNNAPPHTPHEAYNQDTEQARASIRKLAELEPSEIWLGHGKPIRGSVKQKLLATADR